MDPMSPSQLSKCFGVKGSPLGGWENPEIDEGPSMSLTSTVRDIEGGLGTPRDT